MTRKISLLSIPILLLTGLFLFISSCNEEEPVAPKPDPAATSIALVAGGSQTATIETACSSQVEVLVKDQEGKAFAGAKVNFAVTEGAVSSGSVTTNASGKASVTWTLGATVGAQTLTITAFKANGTTALSGAPLSVTATAKAPLAATSIELVTGGGQSALVETTLNNPIKVLVKDQDGNGFAGTTVNFVVTEGSVSAASATTDANGMASITWTLGATIGSQLLTVTAVKADGTTALTGSPLTVTATADEVLLAASIELVSGGDQSAPTGNALTNPIVVLVKDQNGDGFAGATVNFAVTEGAVSATSVTTDANGNVSITWTLGTTVGTQTLTATAFKEDNSTALTGSPLAINASGASTSTHIYTVSGGNQTGVVSTVLANMVTVVVRDQNGQAFEGTTVNFSVTEGSVSAASVTSDVQGFASISWTLGPTLGMQTLTVTAFRSDGTTALIGSPLTINANAIAAGAWRLKLASGGDQTGKVGIPLTNPILMQVYPQYGGPYPDGETVYFAVTEGSVSPTSAVSDANGLASTTWTPGPTVGTQTLTVTGFKADGTTPLENSPLLVNATVEQANVTGTVTDYDGNVYQTVQIGSQVWMAENLKVTHFSDGTAIAKVTADADWANLTTTDPAYSYVNNVDNSEYGVFYTRNAAMNGAGSSTTNPSGIQGVCPVGWHIPSDAEWLVLKTGLTAADLREAGLAHWLAPNDANNESGFTALGAGYRNFYQGGIFVELKESGNWWLSDIYTYNGKAYSFYIGHFSALDFGTRYANLFNNGFSVRCVKD